MNNSSKLSFTPSTVAISLLLGVVAFMGHTLLQNQKALETSNSDSEVQIVTIETVTALGRLEPQGKVIDVSVSANSQGSRLEQLMVSEGDYVAQGEIIGFLSDRQVALKNVKEAEKKVRLADAKLTQIKAGAKQGEINRQQATIDQLNAELQGIITTYQAKLARLEVELLGEKQAKQAQIARLEAELQNVQQDFDRYQFLGEQGAISRSDLDLRQLQVNQAEKQLLEAQANSDKIQASLEQQIKETQADLQQKQNSLTQQIQSAIAELARIKEIRFVDVDVIQAEVQQVQASLAIAQAKLEDTYIKAPRSGQVLSILTRQGEAISGEGIVRIGNTKSMYAIAEVHESDITKVELGQTARIKSSSLPEGLEGTVEHIGLEIQRQEVVNADPVANIDAKVVEVKIKLDNSSSQKVASLTNLLVTVTIDLN